MPSLILILRLTKMMLSSGYGASSHDAYTSVSVTHNKNLAYVLKVLRIGLVNEKIGNYIHRPIHFSIECPEYSVFPFVY